jgi:acyl-CoA reductase-like NAD-dependent aldehyde dehydrogenase
VVAPTLVEPSEPKLHRLRVWCEEVFGPVATVEPINSFAQGIAATDDSPYGLHAPRPRRRLAIAIVCARKC